MERGELSIPESDQERSEQWQAEALEIAQRISHLWKQLDAKVQADPNILVDSPEIGYVYDLTKSPTTGIQTWFEGQMNWIENAAGGDEHAKSVMMHSLKKHAARIEQQVNEILA